MPLLPPTYNYKIFPALNWYGLTHPAQFPTLESIRFDQDNADLNSGLSGDGDCRLGKAADAVASSLEQYAIKGRLAWLITLHQDIITPDVPYFWTNKLRTGDVDSLLASAGRMLSERPFYRNALSGFYMDGMRSFAVVDDEDYEDTLEDFFSIRYGVKSICSESAISWPLQESAIFHQAIIYSALSPDKQK